MMAQIQELQIKVNSLSDARDFYDSGSSSGADPRSWSNFYGSEFQDLAAAILDCREIHRIVTGIVGDVFERPPFQEGLSSRIFHNSKGFASSSQGLRLDTTDTARKRENGIEKRIAEYTDSITVLPKQKWNVFPYRWNLFSQWFGWLSKSSIAELNLGKFPDPMEFQAGRQTSELRFVWKQPILKWQCSGSKKLRSQNQLTDLWHRDRLWGETISPTSICLMRWLRLHWKNSQHARYTSEKE